MASAPQAFQLSAAIAHVHKIHLKPLPGIHLGVGILLHWRTDNIITMT
ncbi:hypothetical protein CPter291_1805 [Collimonas pratensis]|uniref:Uncharacterized protein n=1 Tax=Collimonas pratensis TaxID=279113 RepID=A0A127QVU4_9BURK|nr:hypothetical protein CPter91_1769 [Collimonas pratensis]AMP14071.1 hypothetical protein CPter291_1805 [Collimonas pratensis]